MLKTNNKIDSYWL